MNQKLQNQRILLQREELQISERNIRRMMFEIEYRWVRWNNCWNKFKLVRASNLEENQQNSVKKYLKLKKIADDLVFLIRSLESNPAIV